MTILVHMTIRAYKKIRAYRRTLVHTTFLVCYIFVLLPPLLCTLQEESCKTILALVYCMIALVYHMKILLKMIRMRLAIHMSHLMCYKVQQGIRKTVMASYM